MLVEKSDPNKYLPDKYWLLNREKLVLKSIPAGVIATPGFRDFPRIKGLSDPGITSGVKWNSLALERGLQFLETVGTWAEKTQPASTGNLEDLPTLLPSLSSTKGLVLDLTDPLNLMMRWRFSAEESGEGGGAKRQEPKTTQFTGAGSVRPGSVCRTFKKAGRTAPRPDQKTSGNQKHRPALSRPSHPGSLTPQEPKPVSYTHLTLPTKRSV